MFLRTLFSTMVVIFCLLLGLAPVGVRGRSLHESVSANLWHLIVLFHFFFFFIIYHVCESVSANPTRLIFLICFSCNTSLSLSLQIWLAELSWSVYLVTRLWVCLCKSAHLALCYCPVQDVNIKTILSEPSTVAVGEKLTHIIIHSVIANSIWKMSLCISRYSSSTCIRIVCA